MLIVSLALNLLKSSAMLPKPPLVTAGAASGSNQIPMGNRTGEDFFLIFFDMFLYLILPAQ